MFIKESGYINPHRLLTMKRLYTFILILTVVINATAQTTFQHGTRLLETNLHTWLVKPQAPKDETGSSWVFCSVREALIAADSLQRTIPTDTFTGEHPLRIYIAPWVYWMDNPDDPTVRRPLKGEGIPYGLKVKVSHIRLIGLSDNPEYTILACNRGQTQGAVGNFTMLHLEGEDISLENLTLGNYCNIDLEYSPNSSLNRKRRADAIVQAQLAICHGDRIAAYNCHFISRLNSCPLVGAKRTYFEDCYFECTDDALCGTGIHHRCQFKLFSGKPFYSTQGTGAIFLNCDLHTLTNGQQYLVKAGSPVTMVDCRWKCENKNLVINWTQDPTDDLRSYQYNLTQNNLPLYIDQQRPHLTVDMENKTLLEAYRLQLPKKLFHAGSTGDTIVYNLLNLTGNLDGWNPAKQSVEIMKEYTKKHVGLVLNHRRATVETGKDTLHLKASLLTFMERPDFSQTWKKLRWYVAEKNTTCVKLEPQADGSLIVTGQNMGENTETINILCVDSTGLETACVLTVRPQQLPAPNFTTSPTISRKGDTLTVNYALDLNGRADESIISWYRCISHKGEEAIPVAVNRPDKPIHQRNKYVLTAADKDKYIQATITPKHPRSPYGKPFNTISKKKTRIKEKRINQYKTDFSDFPTERQPRLIAGHWTSDAHKPDDTHEHEWKADTIRPSWTYGNGVDGAIHRKGLIQNVRGARLRYTPLSGEYGDMEILLHVAPCKTAGQGFGSATGQYMDIGIKMDTHTMTGYALRIIRTTKHDKAVDFQLMEYKDGTASPISEAISSICYRTGCIIHLKTEGNKLIANVHNELPLPAPHRPGLTSEVNLSAPIQANHHGGICIQHTGSTGASATVLESMEIRWKD